MNDRLRWVLWDVTEQPFQVVRPVRVHLGRHAGLGETQGGQPQKRVVPGDALLEQRADGDRRRPGHPASPGMAKMCRDWSLSWQRRAWLCPLARSETTTTSSDPNQHTPSGVQYAMLPCASRGNRYVRPGPVTAHSSGASVPDHSADDSWEITAIRPSTVDIPL